MWEIASYSWRNLFLLAPFSLSSGEGIINLKIELSKVEKNNKRQSSGGMYDS